MAGREEYRGMVLQLLGAAYSLHYHYDGHTVLVLRVFYGREA